MKKLEVVTVGGVLTALFGGALFADSEVMFPPVPIIMFLIGSVIALLGLLFYKKNGGFESD